MKGQLKHGDLARIAESTGYTRNYVCRVLTMGDRKSAKIERVAQELLRQREALKTPRVKQ